MMRELATLVLLLLLLPSVLCYFMFTSYSYTRLARGDDFLRLKLMTRAITPILSCGGRGVRVGAGVAGDVGAEGDAGEI
jgi:hypothetical protein